MTDITYAEVVKFAEQLPPHELNALIEHLEELARQRQLTVEERLALFKSMTVDLGPVSPNFSDKRADWYGDDER